MKKFKTLLKMTIVSLLVVIFGTSMGQTTVHTSDFNVSEGAAYTTSGQIGTSSWHVDRLGDDWGARIHDDMLELTNTAGFAANAVGWVYAYTSTAAFTPPYNTNLEQNNTKVSWYFNMQQIRSNPAGFNSNNYGVAFIIGSTDTDVFNNGDGYAVVLGNSGTPDPVRFVKFSNGISSIGASNTGLIVATTELDNPQNNYMSLKLTYDPATDIWELFGRDDGGAAFADPQTGTLTSLGTVVDNDYTDVALNYMGAYWQGGTAGNQTAFFDNVSVLVDPPLVGPNIVVVPNTLFDFYYIEGHGPSDEQQFTIEGSNLSDDISITAPANYEISEQTGAAFTATDPIILSETGGTVNPTTIYVRLKEGLAGGIYDNETITASSAGATNRTITCSGEVLTPVIATLPYAETFDSDLGDCYTFSVSGSHTEWAHASFGGNGFAQINGHGSTELEEHWLILPGIVLNNDSVILEFNTAYNWGTEDADNYLKLYYSTDYPGVGPVTAFTWTEIPFDKPTSGSYTWAGSGEITLPDTNATIWLGFKYHFDTDFRLWRIDDVNIYEILSEPDNHVTNFTAATNSHNSITVSWDDAIGTILPTAYLVKAAEHPDTPTAPVDGIEEADSTLVLNIAFGVEEAVFTGLNPETTYNFAIWPYTNSGLAIDYKIGGEPTAQAETDVLPYFYIYEDISSWTSQSGYGNYSQNITVGTDTGVVNLTQCQVSPGGSASGDGTVGNVQMSGTDGIIELPSVPSVSFIEFTASAFGANRSVDIEVYDGTTWVLQTTIAGIGTTGTTFDHYINLNTPTQIRLANPSAAIKIHDIRVAANGKFFSGVTHITSTESFDNVFVMPGAHLEIESSGTLNVNGNFTILSDANGTGSLIDNGTLNITGDLTVQKFLPNITTTGWYFAAPISDADHNLFDDADGLYHYGIDTDGNGLWIDVQNTAGTLTLAKGYVTRFNTLGADHTIPFEGAPNTGIITNNNLVRTTTTHSGNNYGWNLVGNPYPSPIDWLSAGITKTNLDAAVSFRKADGGVEYYIDDNAGGSSAGGSRYIPAMQAFWVQVSLGQDNAAITFENQARVNQGDNHLLKMKNNPALHLFVERSGHTDESIIRFLPSATDLYDGLYDAFKMFSLNQEHPQLYSILSNNQELAINSLPPLVSQVTVVKGFDTEHAGQHTINVSGISSFDSSIDIYLEDLYDSTVVDLRQHNSYTFNADAGTTANRFLVHFNPLSTQNHDINILNDMSIYAYKNDIYVINTGENAHMDVYNMMGQKVFTIKLPESNFNKISTPLSAGQYIVRITENNGTASQRIIIN